ncbi:Aryl-alcohol dehydrogenase protein [Rutstroemia sp. NJR-2017a WRK4]|nr:Aryl-alcohol dehydrogenase protein [Rutstroemia sp. NJR-2017a WRK4]
MEQLTGIVPVPLFHGTISTDKDEWRGKSNARERKKIQNRINQRARRSRQRKQSDDSCNNHNIVTARSNNARRSLPDLIDAVIRRELSLKALVDAVRILDLQSNENLAIIRVFEGIVHQTRASNVPRPAMLSSLAQFNISRALISNAEIFGLTAHHLHDDALSPFVMAGPWHSSINLQTSLLPPGLRPTALQSIVEHHPWIDLLPIPQLRDNILQRGIDTFDEVALCTAFTGLGHERGTGILVWGESWDASGYEVTQELIRSWGWLFDGCSDLLRSTDLHRARRGERQLSRLS